MSTKDYVGTELEVFQHATNWKVYWSSQMRPFVSGKCCEVGAGLGANLSFLQSPKALAWTMIEPDPQLCIPLSKLASDDIRIVKGDLRSIANSETFDSIVYIDVLEHIQNDVEQVELATKHLAPNGHLCVLVPAHEWLRSPFDDSIGHVRRYDRARFVEIAKKAQLEVVILRELDSVGLFASLANKFVLLDSSPSHAQISFWDKGLVPLSKFVDRLVFHKCGKSILAVFKKPAT
jgi:hypothetical protein